MSRSKLPDVSIVTVNWNGRRHLEALLSSLSTVGAREIIVVDNGSTDGSQRFLRAHYPNVRILQNALNQGFAEPSNLGARHAEGKHVAFVNNDMQVDARWLDSALERLSESTPCVASRILDWQGQRVQYNGASLQYLGYALQRDIGSLVADVTAEDRVLFPCGGAMVVDRDIFLAVGGFDEDYFAVFEDVDFGWRLWLAGYEVALAADSIVYHRGHATFERHGNERLRYLMHRNALLTILKNYEEETVRRVLPLAVAMALKRAVLFSGVEKEAFYLWGRAKRRLDVGNAAAQRQLIDALNHIVAVQDVLEVLPRTLEKRREVQSRRRRSDAEVLELFVDPMRAIVPDPDYIAHEIEYLELLGLDALFDGSQSNRHLASLPTTLQDRINNLRAELRGLQWSVSGTGVDLPVREPRLAKLLARRGSTPIKADSANGTSPSVQGFSVVIPTRDRPAVLKKTLLALMSQTVLAPAATDEAVRGLVEPFEVIVVDNGSTDETAALVSELAQSYPVSLRYLYQPHKGAGPARNLGVRNAKKNDIVFLGDDIVPAPDFLARHAEERLKRGNQDRLVLIGRTRWPDHEEPSRFMEYVGEYGWQFGFSIIEDREHVPFNFFYTSNISMTRSFFLEEGGFDEEFPEYGWEDIELGLRLARTGMRLVYVPAAVGFHHHPTSVRSFVKRQRRAGRSAWNFYLKHPSMGEFLDVAGSDALTRRRLLWMRILTQLCAITERRHRPDLTRFYPDVLRHHYLLGLREARRPGESRRAATVSSELRANGRGRPPPSPPTSPSAKAHAGDERFVERVRNLITSTIPPGSAVAVLSGGDARLVDIPRRKASHFPSADPGDSSTTHPLDRTAASAHVQALGKRDADYLFVPATAVSWVDYYSGLRDELERRFPVAARQDDVGTLYAVGGHAVARALAARMGGLQRELEQVRAEIDGRARVERIRELVSAALPPGAKVLVVSQGNPELLELPGGEAVHFPEGDAVLSSASQVAETGSAITRLEELRSQGADYLVVPVSSDSWLERDCEFAQHLERQYRACVREEACVVFALREKSEHLSAAELERDAVAAIRPRFSVVIPVLNRIDLTRRCLDTLLEQSRPRGDLEIIVVDDGSTDATPRVLARYGDQIQVVRHATNTGFATACNDGAAIARSEYIVFLNNDTIPQPGWLEALGAYADRHPEAAVIGAKLLYPNGTIQHAGVVVCQDRYPRHIYAGFRADHPAVNKSRRFQIVTAACALVRRGAFEEVGGFDPAFQNGCEDVDLCLRLGARGHEIHYCHESVAYHLESATEGRWTHDDENNRLWHSRWAHRAQRDDIDYYLRDGLLSLRYQDEHPPELNVSRELGDVVSEDGERHLVRSLSLRPGQLFGLVHHHIRRIRRERELRHRPSRPAPPSLEPHRSGRRADGWGPRSRDYMDLVNSVRFVVHDTVPPGETILVVTKGDEELLKVDGLTAWHFPASKNGSSRYPATSEEAISALEELREGGARFLVIPRTALWWLEHYADFGEHLRTRCATVFHQDDIGAIFALGERLVAPPVDEEKRYRESIPIIRERVRESVAPDSTVIVVSKGDEELLKLDGRQGWHFPQDEEGRYAGHHPADSGVAIAHLEQLREKGAEFLLFPSFALWWLDHYADLRRHLERRYRLIFRDDETCAIFSLRPARRRLRSLAGMYGAGGRRRDIHP